MPRLRVMRGRRVTDRREFLKLSAASAGAAALAATTSSATAQTSSVPTLKQYLGTNAFKYFSLPPMSDEQPKITLAGPVTKLAPDTSLPAGRIYPLLVQLIGGLIRQHLGMCVP